MRAAVDPEISQLQYTIQALPPAELATRIEGMFLSVVDFLANEGLDTPKLNAMLASPPFDRVQVPQSRPHTASLHARTAPPRRTRGLMIG